MLSISAHCNMLSVIVGRKSGIRELYMQDFLRTLLERENAREETKGGEENWSSGTMTLVLAGGGLDAPMAILLRQKHSLVLLLSGAIISLSSDDSSISKWASPEILGAKEMVIGHSVGKNQLQEEVILLLGDCGTVMSFSHRGSGANEGCGQKWVFPPLALGDLILQVVGSTFDNVMFVTKKGRVFAVGYPQDGVLGVSEERAKEGPIRKPVEVPLLLRLI
eukprot:TRINITY_DN1870_c0_g1_i2.p1 TRINITY_DN1870_c0_g1~~TRINITY_DN1870_c0_g1_i2.p1  ORF type:complete len:221 (-),score=32.47 TRINITY_DN1870_c0_g1_i2:7-669(-)